MMQGWPELTNEQATALYCIEDGLEQAREADRLGLCNEAREQVCTWHSETDCHEHYQSCRVRKFRERRGLRAVGTFKGRRVFVDPFYPEGGVDGIDMAWSDAASGWLTSASRVEALKAAGMRTEP